MINDTNIKAGAIANEFLKLAEASGASITNLKILKICYIAQGLSLSILGRAAFSESIEAWKYGPVIPSLYHEFKRFAATPIKDYRSSEMNVNYEFEENILNDGQLKGIAELTWNLYGDMSAEMLVDLTHQNGTPWAITRLNNKKVINNTLIKNYYDIFIQKLKLTQ